MICSKCGRECPDGTKFCTNCGAELKAEEVKTAAPAEEAKAEAPAEEVKAAPVEEVKKEEVKKDEAKKEEVKAAEPEKKEEKPEGEKKKFSVKKLIPVAFALVALILVIVLVKALVGGKAGYMTMAKKGVVKILKFDGNAYAMDMSGSFKDLKTDISGNPVYSADHSVAVFMNGDKELCVLKNGKVIETGFDEVREIVVSAKGNSIAFFTNVKDGVGTLVVYDVNKKKEKEVADDVYVNGGVVFSQDGKTVAYLADYESRTDFKGYYCTIGKKPVELGKEKRIVAIANKAKYIYYQDDDRLYVKKGKKDGEKLASDISSTVDAFINADGSEFMFSYDGKTFITVKGKEKTKVCNTGLDGILLPQDFTCNYYSSGNVDVYEYGVKTFAKQIYVKGSDLYYAKKTEADKISGSFYRPVLSKDGKTVIYLSSTEEICKLTDFAKGGKKTTLVKDADVVDFQTDIDCKKIYFVNDDDELCFLKGKKAKKVSDEVDEYALSTDGSYVYFVVDEEDLYYSKNGGKRSKMKSAETISVIGNCYFVVCQMSDDDDNISFSRLDGKKPKEVFKYER